MYRKFSINLVIVLSLIVSGCGKDKETSQADHPQTPKTEEQTPNNPSDKEGALEQPDVPTSGTATLTKKKDSITLCEHLIKDKERGFDYYTSGCEIWFGRYHDNSFSGGHRYEEAVVLSLKTPLDWEEFVLKDGLVTIKNPRYRAHSKMGLDTLNARLHDPFLIKPDVSYVPIEEERFYFFRYWNELLQKSFFFKVHVTEYHKNESVTFDWERLEELPDVLDKEPKLLKKRYSSLIDLNYRGTVELWARPHQYDYSFRHMRYGHMVQNNEAYYIGADIRYLPQREALELERAGQQHNYSVRMGNVQDFYDLILTDEGLRSKKNLQNIPEHLEQANKILFSDRPRTDSRDYDLLKDIGGSFVYVIRCTAPNQEDLIVKLMVISYTKGQRAQIRWERMYPIKLSLPF